MRRRGTGAKSLIAALYSEGQEDWAYGVMRIQRRRGSSGLPSVDDR